MKFPPKTKYHKTLKIKGEEWRIAFVDVIEGEDTAGMCDPSNRIIYIQNKQSRAETAKTFIHEVLHALDDEYSLNLSHPTVYKLEIALYEFLKDNF